MLTVSRARADQVARLVVGSLLLLPALGAYGLVFWLPLMPTLSLSLLKWHAVRAGGFAGLANYAYLVQDSGYWAALGRSALVALVRLAAVTVPPSLIAWGLRRQGRELRLAARLALCLGLALSAPAALGLLWRLAEARTGLLQGPAGWEAQGLISYLALELVAFLGVGGGLAALAQLLIPAHATRAARGALALAAVAAVASSLSTFALPFALGGGARRGQVTASLHLFRLAFQQLRLGEAAAEALPLLVLGVALGICFGLLAERAGLKLVPARAGAVHKRELPALAAGLAGLALLLLPLLLLYLWGAGLAFLYPGQPVDRAADMLEAGLAIFNGNLAPVAAILFVQLPAAYLAALSLTLVRPFGRRGSSLAYLALLASGFVPPMVTGTGLFLLTSRLGLLNTIPAGGLTLLAGPASLFLFRLYFRGQEPRLARAVAGGENAVEAFLRHSLGPSLPVVGLAGAVSLLLAGQCFLWPLLVLLRSEFLPLSLRLLRLQAVLAGEPALLGAGAWLTLTCWGVGMLLMWWPLQALVLERMELVAE